MKNLCWNIRGINSEDKCRSVREKVGESGCSVLCLQEAKKDHFDNSFIRKIVQRQFDKFVFSPSTRASRGLLIVWNSALFLAQIVHQLSFAITITSTSCLNSEEWTLTNVYGPCNGPQRDDFVDWLYHLNIPSSANCFLCATLTLSDLQKTEDRWRYE